MRSALLGALALAGASAERHNAVWSAEKVKEWGYQEKVTSPLPHTYVKTSDLPENFSWGNVNGVSYLTKNLNQHIPQYCGSCWAHGAISALGDRIKIARKAQGVEINLSVQHILNCGNAGSCYGGNSGPAYQWIEQNDDGVVFDTCNPYIACSSDSKEGMCGDVDTTCKAENICRTCSTFSSMGGFCTGIDKFPNATVAEHGTAMGEDAMMKEIYARGTVAGAVDANPLITYSGGIASGKCGGADHAISVTGWGVEDGKKYWIVRNSWGEFWGEMGYFRVERGNGNSLCIEESGGSWATPGAWTEHNFPCGEDGTGCAPKHGQYVDPSAHGVPLGKKYSF